MRTGEILQISKIYPFRARVVKAFIRLNGFIFRSKARGSLALGPYLRQNTGVVFTANTKEKDLRWKISCSF